MRYLFARLRRLSGVTVSHFLSAPALCAVTMAATIYIIHFAVALFVALALGAFALVYARTDSSRIFRLSIAVAAGLLLGAVTNLALARQEAHVGQPIEAVTRIEGVVAEDARTIGGGQTLLLSLELNQSYSDYAQASARGRVVCFVPQKGINENADLSPRKVAWGERIALSGVRLRADPDPATPLRCNAAHMHRIPPENAGIRGRALEVRAALLRRLGDAVETLPPPADELFSALFIGRRDALGEQTRLFFRRSGAAHVLALSGMHLAIVAGVLVLLLRPFLGPTKAIGGALVGAVCYVAMAGGRPSLLRALITFALFAGLRRRNVAPTNILALAFILLSLAAPSSTMTISFQLSFLALAGIMVLAQPFANHALPALLPPPLRLPIAASIAAQIATAPLSAVLFGELYPIGILSSLLLTPLAALIIWLGLCYLCLSPLGISPVTSILSSTLRVVAEITVECGRILSRAPPIYFDINI